MIIIELTRARRPGEAERVAHIQADGRDIWLDGPEPELVDRNQAVLNLRDGQTIRCDDDPEEWVRGLAASFRTPYLYARVVKDTNPLTDVEITPANVAEPVVRS